MRDLAVFSIVLVGLILTLREPHVGVLLWSWISYMNPHRLTWGYAFDFPFAQVIAITTFVSLVFYRGPKWFPWNQPIMLVWLAFILFMALTTTFSMYPDEAWPHLVKVLKIQLFAFLTVALINDRRKIDQMVWVIVISLGFYGIKGGIFTILQGGSHRVYGPPGTFIEGNNEIALALLMTIPLMYYLFLQNPIRWVRYGLAAAIFLTALASLGSQSRGAYIAAGCTLVFLWLHAPARQKVILLFLLVPLVPLILGFMPDSWHTRMATIGDYENDASAMGRLNAWQFAINLASARPLGGGFESFTPQAFQLYAPDPLDFHDSHSIYFQVLGHHGYGGLALFLLLIFLGWTTCGAVARRTKERPDLAWLRSLTLMVRVSLVAFISGGAFLGLAYFDFLYSLIALLIVARMIVDRAPLPIDMQKPEINAELRPGQRAAS